MKFFEISSKKNKSTEKHFRAVLFKIQPDECVRDHTGTKYNDNGITWIEEYCEKNLSTAIGRSITVEFIDENRTQISGHGETGIEDGVPIFNNATVIGHFEKIYITEMEIDGKYSKVCIGEGVLDYMRYKPFLDVLEQRLNQGETIYGSVEIIGKPENDNKIIYLDGWKQFGRIPVDFIISGWAILDILPSDNASQILELNQREKNKEDDTKMDEKILKELIVSTIKETNSSKDEDSKIIAELNDKLSSREIEINTLKEAKDAIEATISDKDAKILELETALNSAKSELNVCKIKELNSKLDERLSKYTSDQKAVALNEINSYKENPLEGNVDQIISKICVAMVEKQLEFEKSSELNSKQKLNDLDIFSEVNSFEDKKNEDDNIF